MRRKFPNFAGMPNLRKLLYPFSLLYGGITDLRNVFYDRGIFKSESFEVPVIAVGNLSVGGTGKSPMIEYLIELLKEYRVATLSRGYKRMTTGFHILEGSETAEAVGDEPLQFKNKFPGVTVAVDENRIHGINELLKEKDPDIILLDDAFQHRKVQAGLYILLTSYDRLYTDDLILPAGNLRESSKGAKRADIVVVTKCPAAFSEQEMEQIRKKLKLDPRQHLFFSRIEYEEKIFAKNRALNLEELQKGHFTLVTGIANPKPLVDFLKQKGLKFDHRAFPDHHNFSGSEVESLQKEEMIITTEKDYMRLKNAIFETNLFYLPIRNRIIKKADEFEGLILNFAQKK